ncbi:MAG: hypothetical protein LM590_11195 [Thermofilum sp.]|jgi:hypothetical protein|nr:hypothetical protein [Thermofilum sp.]
MASVEKVLERALRIAEEVLIREGLNTPKVQAIIVTNRENRQAGFCRADEGVFVDIVSETIYVAPGTLDNVVYRFLVGYFTLAFYNSFGKIDKKGVTSLARKYFFKVFISSVKDA